MDVDPVESATGADEDNAASRDRERIRLNTWVAVTVALLATFLGVCKVKDDNIVQAMQQAQADKLDHWNFYQARNIRQEVASAALAQLQLAAAAAPAAQQDSYRAAIAKYEALVADQTTKKEELRQQAEQDQKNYDALNYRDDQFDLSGRTDCARDFVAGADRADPQALALLGRHRRHDRRRLVRAGRAARMASPSRPARAVVV